MKRKLYAKTLINSISFSMLVFFLIYGCSSVQQQIKDVSAKTYKAFGGGEKSETQPPEETKKTRDEGFVVNIQNYLPIKLTPSKQAKETGRLYLGDKVAINEEQTGWYHVARIDEASKTELQGWVIKDYVEILPPDEQYATSLIDLAYIRGDSSLTETDENKSTKTRTIAEGGVTGAAGGAAIGALTGLITGEGVAKSALYGAAGGAVAGVVAGIYVSDQKEKFATEEEFLEAATQEAIQQNEEVKNRNQRLANVIAVTEQEVVTLKYKIQENNLKQQRVKSDKKTLERISKETEDRIEELQSLLRSQENAVKEIADDTAHMKELQDQRTITRNQIEELKTNRERLVDLIGQLGEQTV